MTACEKLNIRSKSTVSYVNSSHKQSHITGFLTGRTVKPSKRIILPQLNINVCKPEAARFYNNRKLLSLPKIEQGQRIGEFKRTDTFDQSRPIANEKIYGLFVGKEVKKDICQVKPIIDETVYPLFARKKGRSSSRYGFI